MESGSQERGTIDPTEETAASASKSSAAAAAAVASALGTVAPAADTGAAAAADAANSLGTAVAYTEAQGYTHTAAAVLQTTARPEAATAEAELPAAAPQSLAATAAVAAAGTAEATGGTQGGPEKQAVPPAAPQGEESAATPTSAAATADAATAADAVRAEKSAGEWYVILTADALAVLMQSTLQQQQQQHQQQQQEQLQGQEQQQQLQEQQQEQNTAGATSAATSIPPTAASTVTGATGTEVHVHVAQADAAAGTGKALETPPPAEGSAAGAAAKTAAAVAAGATPSTEGAVADSTAAPLFRDTTAEPTGASPASAGVQEAGEGHSTAAVSAADSSALATDASSAASAALAACGSSYPVGPLSVEVLRVYFERCLVDGCSLCWREGMHAWQPLCEIDELKAVLQSVAPEEEASLDLSPALQRDEQEGRQLDPLQCMQQQKQPQQQVTPRRKPLAAVPNEFKYVTPEGVAMVYDDVDNDWKTADEYEALEFLSAAAAAAEQTPGLPAHGEREGLPAAEAAARASARSPLPVAANSPPTSSSSSAPRISKSAAASTCGAREAQQQAQQQQGGVGKDEEEEEQQQPEGRETGNRGLTAEQQLRKQQNAEKRRLYRQRQKRKRDAGLWISSKRNPNIYVSGLPADCTAAELHEIFRKAGVLKLDPETLKPKIRLYTDRQTGLCKGDALLSFVHEDSVGIAIKYFDETPLPREQGPQYVMRVQRAEFSAPTPDAKSSSKSPGVADGAAAQGGEEEQGQPGVAAAAGPGRSKGARDKRKYLAAKYEQERLLSWGDAVDDGTGRRIIIIKPVYSEEQAALYEEGDPFYEELRQELFEEIAQFARPEKVTVIPRHVQGLACVKLKSCEDAEQITELFRGRYFDGRQLDVFFFDGKSDLKANCIPSNRPAGGAATVGATVVAPVETLYSKQQAYRQADPAQAARATAAREAAARATAAAISTAARNAAAETAAARTDVQQAAQQLRTTHGQKERAELQPAAAGQAPTGEEDLSHKNEMSDRLERFGAWVDEQSSDEEFEIRTED